MATTSSLAYHANRRALLHMSQSCPVITSGPTRKIKINDSVHSSQSLNQFILRNLPPYHLAANADDRFFLHARRGFNAMNWIFLGFPARRGSPALGHAAVNCPKFAA